MKTIFYKSLTTVICLLTICLCACDILPHKSSNPTAQPTAVSDDLQVHFIDVGQGDAILIDLGTTEVLIDAGDKSNDITDYIDDYVDGHIEAVVATHPHADHIGGLIEVLDEFDVDNVWYNGDDSTSKTYTEFISEISDEGAQIHMARRGNDIVAGTLTLHVLNPIDPLFENTNDNSIVLGLSYGNVDFLFEGDAEIDAEAGMISAGILGDIDILKVGHHCSRTASSPAFLAIVRPEVAIYMAEVGNTYGHPHIESITALQNIGAAIYGTDTRGTIIISTDGATYTIQTDK